MMSSSVENATWSGAWPGVSMTVSGPSPSLRGTSGRVRLRSHSSKRSSWPCRAHTVAIAGFGVVGDTADVVGVGVSEYDVVDVASFTARSSSPVRPAGSMRTVPDHVGVRLSVRCQRLGWNGNRGHAGEMERDRERFPVRGSFVAVARRGKNKGRSASAKLPGDEELIPGVQLLRR